LRKTWRKIDRSLTGPIIAGETGATSRPPLALMPKNVDMNKRYGTCQLHIGLIDGGGIAASAKVLWPIPRASVASAAPVPAGALVLHPLEQVHTGKRRCCKLIPNGADAQARSVTAASKASGGPSSHRHQAHSHIREAYEADPRIPFKLDRSSRLRGVRYGPKRSLKRCESCMLPV
jgi:hypothetical protein